MGEPTLEGFATDLVVTLVIAVVKVEVLVRVLDHTKLALAVDEEAEHSLVRARWSGTSDSYPSLARLAS